MEIQMMIKKWYDRIFTNDKVTNKLADVIWCGDKSLVSGLGYANNASNFGFSGRKYNPILTCPTSDKINGELGNLLKYTAIDTINGNGMLKAKQDNETYKYYPIGLITADEYTFAGGRYALYSSLNFLFTGDYYWTMSALLYNISSNSGIFDINSGGTLSWHYSTQNLKLRPMVALIPSVTLTDTPNQDGTKEHPFEIFVPNN